MYIVCIFLYSDLEQLFWQFKMNDIRGSKFHMKSEWMCFCKIKSREKMVSYIVGTFGLVLWEACSIWTTCQNVHLWVGQTNTNYVFYTILVLRVSVFVMNSFLNFSFFMYTGGFFFQFKDLQQASLKHHLNEIWSLVFRPVFTCYASISADMRFWLFNK